MSFYDNLAKSTKDTPMSWVIFLMFCVVLTIGVYQFGEDLNSSYLAAKGFEQVYGYKFNSFNSSGFILISVLPQIISFIALLSIAKLPEYRSRALLVAFVAQAVDVYTDLWLRTGNTMFDSMERFLITLSLTILLYTVGSEIAISVGISGVQAFIRNGPRQLGELAGDFMNAIVGLFEGFVGNLDKKSKPVQQPKKDETRPAQNQPQPKSDLQRQLGGVKKCRMCGKGFGSSQALIDHFNSVHKPKGGGGEIPPSFP